MTQYRKEAGFLVPVDYVRPTVKHAEAKEPFYQSMINVALGLIRFQGSEFISEGNENVPLTGGAVLAGNHHGYLDFIYYGVPAFLQGRRLVRFMAKKAVFDSKISGPLMRGMKHIPVDREAGRDAYLHAVQDLQAGRLVGVFPEATHSRSFELKDFKSGAARMSYEAGVPLIPMVNFGSQRVWTKGGPKHLGRKKYPLWVRVGEPIEATEDAVATTEKLHKVMSEMYVQLKADYIERFGPFPDGLPWMPASLGGSAPTLAEANKMDEEERVRRAAERAAKAANKAANKDADRK